MSDDNKKVIKEISNKISQASKEEDFMLPLIAWQTKTPVSKEINAAYDQEIEEYQKKPTIACDKETSLKLLKKFVRKNFCEFWTTPVEQYLPAISEGTMKLCERVYSHDEAIRYAKELISEFSVKNLAKDFLYGVAHNDPKYRTALACYYYIKNLPDHEFERRWVGKSPDEDGNMIDRYNEIGCAVCGYQHTVSEEHKMRFYHINNNMASFYLYGLMGRSSLNDAILYLEEYKKLPHVNHSPTDYEHFEKIIEVIEKTPPNMTSGKLRRELKQSGLLQMTLEQIEVFIDMLGYLDILHSDDSYGMIYKHTPQRDMLYPLSDRGYAAHPVNRWTRKCGIDYKSISILFDGIYK